MARRTSLREFQEQLAQRLALASAARAEHWLILPAPDHRLLLPLTDASAIANEFALVPVPRAPMCYRGLANVRGNLIGVIDLSWLENRTLTPMGKRAQLLVLATRLVENTALLIPEAVGLRPLEAFTPMEYPLSRPWHERAYRAPDDDRPCILINAARLITDPLFYGIDSGASFVGSS
ncbi:chemotaxis protein CheW [Tepidiphilus margaritifer]|uniref:chemotaxis protein CheW n=1 Tax=Tepidiphilus margaritifer TaxID=203471 RepID=UPI00040B9613|nr:chemotaxis protein CheW [Tepidiphilus margaritifer]